MENRKAIQETIDNATESLSFAKQGFKTIQPPNTPDEKAFGLSNLVVYGRSVTNIIQKLRSLTPSFDTWYKPVREGMESDPVFKYLYELRSVVLKEGGGRSKIVRGITHIKSFNFERDMQKFGPMPSNAVGFFIGDTQGGAGWDILLPDGSKDKIYVPLPGEIGSIVLHLSDSPPIPGGSPTPTLEEIGSYYIQRLEEILIKAKKEFLS